MTVIRTKEFEVLDSDGFKIYLSAPGEPDLLVMPYQPSTPNSKPRRFKYSLDPKKAKAIIELMQAYLEEIE